MYSKRVIFRASCLGMLLFGISLITLGSIVPDLKLKLQLDEISSGTLFSILPFGILTGSMIFGPVVDKFSYRILLSVSCVFMFAGFLGTGFAQSQGPLRICAFLIGFGGGAVNGATNALVADISDKNKSASLSLLGTGLAAGFPVMLGLTGSLYAELSGTAFSLALFIALLGNMIVNYGMGLIARQDASVTLKNHVDKIGPVSSMAFITCVWMTITTVAEILADRGVKLYIHPSHNVQGDGNEKARLDEALAEYKRRITGV